MQNDLLYWRLLRADLSSQGADRSLLLVGIACDSSQLTGSFLSPPSFCFKSPLSFMSGNPDFVMIYGLHFFHHCKPASITHACLSGSRRRRSLAKRAKYVLFFSSFCSAHEILGKIGLRKAKVKPNLKKRLQIVCLC